MTSLVNFLKNNKRILQDPKLELAQAKRGYVYRVDLGIIPKLSTKKVSYALANQITTVSKSRLMTPRVKEKMVNVKLTAQQMEAIENGLASLLFKNP